MNVDGSQMIKGLHYEETYAPVVQWATIRFFISLAILSNWHVQATEQGRQLQEEPRRRAPTRREGPSTAHQVFENPQVAGSNDKRNQIKKTEREGIRAGIPSGIPASNTRKEGQYERTSAGHTERIHQADCCIFFNDLTIVLCFSSLSEHPT